MTEGNLKLEINCPVGQLEIFAPISTWLKMTEQTFRADSTLKLKIIQLKFKNQKKFISIH